MFKYLHLLVAATHPVGFLWVSPVPAPGSARCSHRWPLWFLAAPLRCSHHIARRHDERRLPRSTTQRRQPVWILGDGWGIWGGFWGRSFLNIFLWEFRTFTSTIGPQKVGKFDWWARVRPDGSKELSKQRCSDSWHLFKIVEAFWAKKQFVSMGKKRIHYTISGHQAWHRRK